MKMKVFLAGATGAVGKPLIPLLLEAGHEVVALTRSVEKGKALRTQGASIVVADALDSDKLFDAVCSTRPEVIIHQMTALANMGSLKNFDRDFALTNRLRTEATHTLIRAARTAGTRVLIAQSFCGWPFAPEGGPVKTEEDPLDSNPPSNFKKSHAAIATLESTIRSVTDFNAKALRFGFFYGPGPGHCHYERRTDCEHDSSAENADCR
jgi:2-alkyl-3-oxoalkanoate reductase